MDEKKQVLGLARVTAMQMILETYLKLNNKGSIKEETKDENFKYGEINNEQIALLREYLKDEYKTVGLDLVSLVEKSGESFESTEFSKYEMDEMIRRADQLVVTLDIVGKLQPKNN